MNDLEDCEKDLRRLEKKVRRERAYYGVVATVYLAIILGSIFGYFLTE